MAGTRARKITGGSVRDDRPKRRKSKPSKSPVPVRFWLMLGMATSILTFVLSGTSKTVEPDMVRGEGMLQTREQKEPIFDFYTVLPASEVVVNKGASRPVSPSPDPTPIAVVVQPVVKPVVREEPEVKTEVVFEPTVDVRPESVVASPVEVIPDNPSIPVKEVEAVENKPPGKMQYLLQVGSFRETKDADRLRGKLLLNGFEPQIQSVIVRGTEKWHRVQIGPFPEKEQANIAQTRLAELKIDSILKQQR